MAGRAKEPGPTSVRVAENLRRIRQERGLSFAELSRRLSGIGHPIPDTSLLKTEKGDRRVDVDDLMALALALEVTPNRLLLPPGEAERVSERNQVTSAVAATWPRAWAWASGEVPFGHQPASATETMDNKFGEVRFGRENRPQHWEPWGRGLGQDQDDVKRTTGPTYGAMIRYIMLQTVRSGMDTAHIRMLVETSIAVGLLAEDSDAMDAEIRRLADALSTEVATIEADG